MTGPAPTYFAYRTPLGHVTIASVSYTHLTLPTIA